METSQAGARERIPPALIRDESLDEAHPAYWRFIASFLIFLASFFSLGVLAGSFFVAFLLSWLLLMMFAPG
jgi:hypothetical protein